VTSSPNKGEHKRFISLFLAGVSRDPRLPGNAFKLAYQLAIHLNRKTKLAWPSQNTISAATSISESSIKRLAKLLADCGHIEIIVSRGRGHSNRYRLVINPAIPLPEKGFVAEPFYDREKGSNRTRKGSSGEPLPYDDLMSQREGAGSPCARLTARKEDKSHGKDIVAMSWLDKFNQLWQAYDRGHLDNPEPARLAFETACKAGANPDDILAGAKVYIDSKEPRYRKRLDEWLKLEGWKKPPEPSKPKRNSNAKSNNRNHGSDMADLARYLDEQGL